MKARFAFYLILLLVAILAVSSAATFFDAIEDTSGSMKASWRLQVTSLVQVPLAIHEFRTDRLKAINFYKQSWWIIVVSSFFLGGHFSFWATSLDETSMAHSLAFVSSSPILIMTINSFTKSKPNVLQISGVLIGFGGLLVMVLTVSDDKDSTIYGNILAFLGAICLMIYFFCGKYVRKQNIMWVYMFPINFFASIFSYIFAISLQGDDYESVVEWIYTSNWPFALYLGIVSGISDTPRSIILSKPFLLCLYRHL